MEKEYNILAWLDGSLDDEAKAEFKAHLEVDPDFKKEVESAREVWGMLQRQLRREQLKDEISPFLEEASQNLSSPPTSKPKPFWNSKLLSMAAAILFLLVATPFIWNWLDPPTSGPELYTQYFETEACSKMGSSDGGVDRMLDQACIHYNDKSYAQAEAAFRAVVMDSMADSNYKNKARFRLAKSLMQQGKFAQAREQFTQLDASMEYGPRSRWNIVLCFLAEDKPTEVKTALQKMDAAEDFYKGSKRKEILDKIE